MLDIGIFYILSLVTTEDTDEIYIMDEIHFCIQLDIR
jgi:hypothetical protein